MAKGAANALEPLVQALDPANWKDVEEEGTGEDGADKGASGFGQEEEEEEEEVAPTVPLLRAQASRKGADLAGASLVDAEGITEHPSTLKSFFAEHLTDFREMKSDTAAIEVAVRDRADAVQDLAKLLASLKADFMNRTLFALTLITAVSVPVTFLTGLWGMNFEDMTELQDPAAEGSAGFGYKTFWISVMSVIVFELVFMTRLGLFEALK